MPGNLMLIPDGRSIFIAIRADLQNRLIVRELLNSWYNIIRFSYENSRRRWYKMRDLFAGWHKIAKENTCRRWQRLRDIVVVSSDESI